MVIILKTIISKKEEPYFDQGLVLHLQLVIEQPVREQPVPKINIKINELH